MKFNDFLTEATNWDSEEATSYFEQLDRMINNKQLTAYMKLTDENYSTNTVALLKKAQVAWSKIVALGDDFLLTLPFATRTDIEVAITDADSAPTVVRGHVLAGDQHEDLNRLLIGPGYVWARSPGGALPVVLNTWTP